MGQETQFWSLFFGFLTMLTLQIFQYLKSRNDKKDTDENLKKQTTEIKSTVSSEARTVKTALVVADIEKNDKLDTVITQQAAIKTIVNGKHTNTLKDLAETKRALATATGKPEDRAAAELAEKIYRDHAASDAAGS